MRQGDQITLHLLDGIFLLDSHFHQPLHYLGRGHARNDIRINDMDAGEPIFCTHARRRGLRTASYATCVTTGASFSVGWRRPHKHSDGHADRRSDIDETHVGIITRSHCLTKKNLGLHDLANFAYQKEVTKRSIASPQSVTR